MHCLVLPAHPSAFVLYLMSRGLIYGSIPCHGTSYAGCGCGQLLACVCCTQSLIYGLIPPQVVASLVSCGRGGVELQMKQSSNRQCVCCAYYQTQAGKGSNLWWVTLHHPPTLDIWLLKVVHLHMWFQ